MKLRHAMLPLALACALPAIAQAQRGFSVEDMVKLDRYSSPLLTPDGKTVVYAKRTVDADLKASSAFWATTDGKARRISPEGWNVNSPSLSADGKTLYFLSAKSGSAQLYSMPLAGGAPKAVTALALGVDAYKLSPKGDAVALALAVYPECKADLACTKARSEAASAQKTSGVLFDSLFVRHWDTWKDGRMNRVFVAPLGGAAVASANLVSGGLHGDIPAKPFGDLSDLAWSPDGKQLALSVRLETPDQPWSTNFDIYLVNADGSGAPRNLTASNKAWDGGPVFSPDGGKLYYWAMQRPGFEADRHALTELNLASGAVREVAPNWDRSIDGITLSADGLTVYTTAQDVGQRPLFAIDIASGNVRKLAEGGSIGSFDLAGGQLAFARNSLQSGDQLFVMPANGGSPRALTPSAGEQLQAVRFGDYEQFNFKGWGGNTVHAYVVKPWNYVEGRKYPVAFLIHGGPQGSFGNGWSYRWNPQTYAGQGY
ncbi:MAG: S9 family peptidase, partial [Pseudomonadota bacterium]|nr:S9 family peptidase [Pseudomonadota bacterium]